MIKPKHIANFGDGVVSLSAKDYDDLIAWGDCIDSERKRLEKENRRLKGELGQYSQLVSDSVELESINGKSEVVLLGSGDED